MTLLSILDVSELLFPKVHNSYYFQSVNSTVSTLIFPSWTDYNVEYEVLDFSRFIRATSIEIGDDCFKLVKTFQIDGLNRLKTIKIGKKSFTRTKNKCGKNKSKSFHILNCESLESIQIGQFSFSDFAGEFELKNLPQLQSIQIGTIDPECGIWKESNNFYYGSFVLGCISIIVNID